jgi:tripartite-type tricarboxylate transporter receptor subunit TctC
MRSLGCLLGAALLSVSTLGVTAADAQEYPNKPVRILVPYAAGGSTDIVARAIAERLRHALKGAFVIDNKPGAFGIVATEELARAKPDGYTLLLGNVSTNGITPVLFKSKYTIDYAKSVMPVARIAEIPSLLFTTTKNFPPKSVPELVQYAKQNPGKVRYASVGTGSFTHFDMEIFARRAGIELNHIPYKSGAAAAMTDVINGDSQIAFLNLATTGAMTRAGQLRVLATVSDRRIDEFPDVPTLAEAGFPGVGSMNWLALFAPTGTPDAIITQLHKAIVQVAHAPETQELFSKSYTRAVPTASPDDAKRWYDGELANWRRITDEVKVELTD